MTTITAIAKTVDELVHRTIDDPFDVFPRIYACDPDGAYILGEDTNPYELLWKTAKPENLTAMALVVTGWASPHKAGEDSDVAPSKHPERVRVRIVTCVGMDGFATIMRRANEPDEAEDLGDGGEGAIRDAMEAWWGR
jgi:hypothetical protein